MLFQRHGIYYDVPVFSLPNPLSRGHPRRRSSPRPENMRKIRSLCTLTSVFPAVRLNITTKFTNARGGVTEQFHSRTLSPLRPVQRFVMHFLYHIFLIITDLGEAWPSPVGAERHIFSIIYYQYKQIAPTGLGRGLQTCYRYTALTGLSRPSPKSVIIKFYRIFDKFFLILTDLLDKFTIDFQKIYSILHKKNNL
ncbi:Uncharacterized protein dnm_066540 [Desulfonema magnum]|uniref:Uncharacterized protein n=1 Tax=Desulfonema magnum TaxID=45655 RepID=A0A975BS41_9BACT|nr:Uncharacterized protein dnm_066540 [Desulfonema magnum]